MMMNLSPGGGIISQRIIHAIHGAFIADAASMGTHWIYNVNEMAQTVPSVTAPEFLDPPAPRFYSEKEFPGHYGAVGMLSPYGEQLSFVTEYLVETKGQWDGAKMSHAMLDWAQHFGGRPDSALKTFMENMKTEEGQWPNCGADDYQAHCFMKAIPVTCLYAGKPELSQKVTDAIRVHQNNEMAVAFGLAASRILEKILLGASIADALEQFEQEEAAKDASLQQNSVVLRAFVRAKQSAKSGQALTDFLTELSHETTPPDSPFYDLAARGCALPGSFMAPIHLCFSTSSSGDGDDDDTYVQALRTNILVAGDTCSRAQLLGAWLGAAAPKGPPDVWIQKMHPETWTKVTASAQAIAQLQARE